ncbi:biotin transporter BioY [uncultured Anaerofustis sp.]|uniref:biotin transporter BioY n=1 Tax=uncultured Anaerofustis sp. TaxID=904996 RepID=UPI0026350F50|nr:biotin transporter BioY [uncultured Anaerofustis sp.]
MKRKVYLKTESLTKIALCTAVMCILGPISIPISLSPVPISLTQIGIYFAVYALEYKYALISTLLYILIGSIGLPVFSGFMGGINRLLGPTGGYLVGFIFLTLVTGYFIDKYYDNKGFIILGFILGNIICYIIGSLWLAFQSNISIISAFIIGCFPYIPGDIIKSVIAFIVGPKIKYTSKINKKEH